MLHALFKDLGFAIELHEKIANEDTELHSLDTRNYHFNVQEEGDYQESSMKQVSMTRNIYSCMKRGVCLPTESSIRAPHEARAYP